MHAAVFHDLPDEVVAKTRQKYVEAYRLLTGRDPDLS
jgi:hypothetical protein